MKFKYGDYGHISMRHIESARKTVSIDVFGCVWHLQQALETILKHYLQMIWESSNDELKDLLQSHSLILLAKSSRLNLLPKYRSIFKSLTDSYYNEGYPGVRYEETEEDVVYEYLTQTEEIFSIVLSAIESVPLRRVETEVHKLEL